MDGDYTARLERVAGLLDKLETEADPALREGARELVRILLELHERGLRRVLELTSPDPALLCAVQSDVEIERLLFLHGLHPVPLRERLDTALRELAPLLAKEGAHAELAAIEAGVVRLRLRGSAGARQALLRAIDRAAPDAGEVLIEDLPHLVQLRVRKPSSPPEDGGPKA